MEKLKETQKGSVVVKKGTPESDIVKYTSKGIDVKISNEDNLTEAQKGYTTEETAAVGRLVGKHLINALRAQGDELASVQLRDVTAGTFKIKATYGQNRGEDSFKFKLDPESTSIHMIEGSTSEELVEFIVTEGNNVSLPGPELESKLIDNLVKYRSNDLSEKLGPDTEPEEYIKDFKKSKAPQFKGKSKEKKRQMAIAAYMSNKNEETENTSSDSLNIENLYAALLTKLTNNSISTKGLEREYAAATNEVGKLKVINRYKNLIKENLKKW